VINALGIILGISIIFLIVGPLVSKICLKASLKASFSLLYYLQLIAYFPLCNIHFPGTITRLLSFFSIVNAPSNSSPNIFLYLLDEKKLEENIVNE
jgi:hypothetical protein